MCGNSLMSSPQVYGWMEVNIDGRILEEKYQIKEILDERILDGRISDRRISSRRYQMGSKFMEVDDGQME